MLLALGGWLTSGVPLATPVKLLAVLPGALLLAFDGGLPTMVWVQILVVAMTILGAWSVTDFDDRWRTRGYVPVLWAVTVVGVYYTVPDTTEALVLLGVALPLVVLGWPWPVGSFGPAGSWAAVGLLTWTIAIEGYFRQSAVVGGMACLGVLAFEPLIRLLRRDRWTPVDVLPPAWWGVVVLGTAHFGLVFLASRVAGLQGRTGSKGVGGLVPSVLIVGLEVTCVLLFGLTVGRRGNLLTWRRRS
jgi:hypothetical protein